MARPDAVWASPKEPSLDESIRVGLDAILASHVAKDGIPQEVLLGSTFVVLGKQGNDPYSSGSHRTSRAETRSGILYSGSAGRSTFEANSPSYSTDTVTWIASMTKLITVTALFQLVEKGLVSIDEDVRPHLPRVAAMQLLKGFSDDGTPLLEDNTTPITAQQVEPRPENPLGNPGLS